MGRKSAEEKVEESSGGSNITGQKKGKNGSNGKGYSGFIHKK